MRVDTIWAKLAARLGREPTHEEAKREVRRILEEGVIEWANAAKTAPRSDAPSETPHG